MDRDVARHVIRTAIHATRELMSLIPLLREPTEKFEGKVVDHDPRRGFFLRLP